MLSASTALAISATPTEVSTPALRVPRFIFRTTSGSSPWRPPGYRMTRTFPPDTLFHLLATSLSTRNHDEFSGTRVAILIVMGACAEAATTPTTTSISRTTTNVCMCLMDLSILRLTTHDSRLRATGYRLQAYGCR